MSPNNAIPKDKWLDVGPPSASSVQEACGISVLSGEQADWTVICVICVAVCVNVASCACASRATRGSKSRVVYSPRALAGLATSCAGD
ncbi:jg12113 [Pararge aegeria aegeria]|uniref:Jg12113 protein n=1 Tax=Pararge aegeria aegeria TaxID=348720 RepID=A0A8S4QJ67_9NEOP|nr:jg12113 [Pararge aegeria aegeria]